MIKLMTPIIILFYSITGYSQTQLSKLSANDTKISILNGGDFFGTLTSAGYEIKSLSKDQPRNTIYSAAIWIGAEEEDGTLHLSAMTYRQRGQDFYPGPTSNNPNVTRPKYDKIFTVSAKEIEDHISSSANPITQIKDWPGNGDTSIGEPYQLAPFVDVNNNGKYEPTLGDYPKIKGALASYCIYSDKGNHTETGGLPLEVDIHQMFYQEDDKNLDFVNLASFTIVNRSNINYKNFKFGVFVDYDLGNSFDDYIGSDTQLNMTFAYNGDDLDEGPLGFGENPPSQNMMFLNTTLETAMYYNNTIDPINGNPEKASEYYNYLNGRWKNNTNIFFGQNNLTGRAVKCANFGNPLDTLGWSEQYFKNVPGDRRMIGVAKETSLGKNETKCFDIAFVHGVASSGGPLASYSEMKKNAASVKQAYDKDSYGWQSKNCTLGSNATNGLKNPIRTKENIYIYPNPSSDKISIKTDNAITSVQLFTASGKLCKNINISENSKEMDIDISNIPSGLYLLEVNINASTIRSKIVKH